MTDTTLGAVAGAPCPVYDDRVVLGDEAHEIARQELLAELDDYAALEESVADRLFTLGPRYTPCGRQCRTLATRARDAAAQLRATNGGLLTTR